MNEQDKENLRLIIALLNDLPKKYAFIDNESLKLTVIKLLKGE